MCYSTSKVNRLIATVCLTTSHMILFFIVDDEYVKSKNSLQTKMDYINLPIPVFWSVKISKQLKVLVLTGLLTEQAINISHKLWFS